MRFTLSWLRDYLEGDATCAQIAEALTDLGLEVERVEDNSVRLRPFHIARVQEATAHPQADRLRVCQVETWPDGPAAAARIEQVVCGAPNARAGMVGVFAPAGSHIPGTDLDLKAATIRGVASNGMLCSERELMISDAHENVIELPSDAPLGAPFAQWAGLDDPVLEIAVTPNRPDALGVSGIARDLAARGLGRLVRLPVEAVPGRFPCPVGVRLGEDVATRGCPYFAGRVIRNLRNGPSPEWIRRRLRAAGLRPINALVDITNYLTLDRARPIHAFDAARIRGDLHLRLSRAGERLLGLDGNTYSLDDRTVLICDGAGPQSIGGIMGGMETRCGEETTSVFLESAWFDPVMIARSGRSLKILSEARHRFERGVDPDFTLAGLELATRMALDICGGEPSDIVVAGKSPHVPREILLREDRVGALIGLRPSRDEQMRILAALGFAPRPAQAGIAATPPSFRPDVQGETDLVEEIGRVLSLTRLRSEPLPPPSSLHAPSVLLPHTAPPAFLARSRAARALAHRGLHECIGYSFVSRAEAEWFHESGEAVALDNPIAQDLSHMRPSALPGLLRAAARNQARGRADFGLFEVGPAFHAAKPGAQSRTICGLRTGFNAPRHWGAARRAVDVFDARADAETALEALGAPKDRLRVLREPPRWLHPERGGRLALGAHTVLAHFGELHPALLRDMGLKGRAVGFMVYVDLLPARERERQRTKTRATLVLHDFQPVVRDFAFLVAHNRAAADVVRAARGAEKSLIEDVSVFDVFMGEESHPVGRGKKSIAISVRLQPKSATLTDEEIQATCAKIVAAVEKSTGGRLRE